MVILNIFSLTKYTQLVPAYSVLHKPILMRVLPSKLMKLWMIGKTSIILYNMTWVCVTSKVTETALRSLMFLVI